MPNVKTVRVPHLGGIEAAYQMPAAYDASKPTLVLVNSFTTSSELYGQQYANAALTSAMNLLAIELLGHGQTRTARENWTYWDTAEMNLQVLDALHITGKVFVLGTSQGGWITVRMALLKPDRVTIPLNPKSVNNDIVLTITNRSPASSRWAHPSTSRANARGPCGAGTRPRC